MSSATAEIASRRWFHDISEALKKEGIRRSPVAVAGVLKNNIEDGVNFFHMDALSSSVALKVNCDLGLTLMASSLYRYLGQRIGNGYEAAKSRHLFRDFVDATASIDIDGRVMTVQFPKRAHNPLLVAAGFDQIDTRIPWLGNRRLEFLFG